MVNITHPNRGLSSLVLKLVFLLTLTCTAILAKAQSEPTVSTDLLDYPPGATAYITGTGFQAGEEVLLKVEHHDENPLGTDPEYHEPWTVTADENGSFSTSWYVPADGDAQYATFLLSADGQSSGLHAEYIFTDAPRIGALVTVSSSQTVCIPASGTSTASYTVTATRSANGTVNGTYTITGLPAGVTAIYSPATFTANGSSAFPASTLTLTVSSLAAPGVINFSVKCADGGDAGTGSGTLVLNKAASITTSYSNIATVNSPNLCSAMVSYSAPSTTGTPAPTIAYSFSGATIGTGSGSGSGSSFNKGVTTVTITASNSCGSDSKIFTVTVNDTQNPSIAGLPLNIVKSNDVGVCGAVVSWPAPSVTDNCPGSGISQVAGPGSGATFLVGTTTVTYRATDGSGNTITSSFTVTVNDTEAPSITTPAPVIIGNNPGQCTGTVILTPPATSDNCGVASISTAPSFFLVGTTTIVWTVTDVHGNARSVAQAITVQDTESPSITASAAANVSNDAGQCSALISLTAPAVADNCAVAIISNDAPSAFAVGTTTVTWTVTDVHGNSSTDTQLVTVNDTEAPSITASAAVNVSNAAGQCSAIVSLTAPTVADNCGVASVSNDAPATFAVGTTTVTWTITDIHGNSSTDTQLVTVTDTESPSITASADVSVSNDAGQCSAVVSLVAPVVGDNCGVASVSNDAPATFAVGTTTVTWTVTDVHGNSSTDTQLVTVNDTEAPVIVGTSSNIYLSACVSTASWVEPTVTDNCSASIIRSGPASGSTFANGTTTTISYTATDLAGNVTASSFTVTRGAILTASSTATPILCYGGTSTVTITAAGGNGPYAGVGNFSVTAGAHSFTVTDAMGCSVVTSVTIGQPTQLLATAITNNAYLYFGYSGDQSATVTITPSGGVGPYSVSVTINRALLCNQITSSGDELWSAAGGSSVSATCPSSGNGSIPVSTITSLTSGSYTLNMSLMADAIITATITDANGCVTTREIHIDGEDVRCFAGNTTVQKVQLCHRTGSSKNPCVTICVDESAVAEHIAHGDFFGKCNTTCTAPVANARIAEDETEEHVDFSLEAYPNPFQSTLAIQVINPSNREVRMQMMDITGRSVSLLIPQPTDDGVYVFDTNTVQTGLYFMRVNIGKFTKTLKVLKE